MSGVFIFLRFFADVLHGILFASVRLFSLP
jgi:hypothetical protein